MTLTELKEDIRSQIRSSKDCIRELRKTENEGIDRRSGHYSKTGKWDLLQGLQSQVDILEIFLGELNKVKALRRTRNGRHQ